MRILTAALFVALALVPAACNKKSAEAATVAPGAAYDTSEAANAKFLTDYAAQKGVVKTPDGLLYRVIKSGKGKTAQTTEDMVTVLYKGQLITGKTFDETKPGNPASFPAGRLIPGWVEALSLMKEGDEWELVIPANLGYGPEGAGDGAIPGNQTLVFRMTLLKVDPAPPLPAQ